jgi:pyruvate,orthophosphate dikinase
MTCVLHEALGTRRPHAGEDAGEPQTIHFLTGVGLDYVSCSPPRVPVARFEAGSAAVMPSAPSRD